MRARRSMWWDSFSIRKALRKTSSTSRASGSPVARSTPSHLGCPCTRRAGRISSRRTPGSTSSAPSRRPTRTSQNPRQSPHRALNLRINQKTPTSPSPSPGKRGKKAFYWAFGAVVAALSVGILVLALLVTTSGPRVRQVVVQNLSGGQAAITNQGLTVVFDRPIQDTDFDSAVEIQPAVEHTVSYRNQQLSISFDQNLLSNTDYTLTIKPELKDDLGRQMQSGYSYEFTTAQPSFTYLERNYGNGEADRIVEKAPFSQEESR